MAVTQGDVADWALQLEQFGEYLQRERRVGPNAQKQYRSIVKDWIEFSLARGHGPAVFDQALVDTLLDRRAHRNSKGVLTPGTRLSYTSNLKVFCEWASAERPQRSPIRAVASASAPPRRQRTQRESPTAPPTATSNVERGRDQGGEVPAESQAQPSTMRSTGQLPLSASSQLWIESWKGPLPAPIAALEQLLQQGGTTIVRAAFQYSFFVHPEEVRKRTPWYPERARTSREHYPGGNRGDTARWQGRSVTLGDNAYAQHAWAKYTGRPIERRSGFGVRHIWGNPWDPDAFTAGWNLCYMPFWAGMLTEKQHPHPQLEAAVRQAAWNLYFRVDPVCEPPEFVNDPGIDLGRLLGTQPISVLRPDSS